MKMVRFGSVVTKQNETVKPDIDNVATRCIELEHIESATGQLLGTIDFSNTTSTKNAFSAGDCLFGKLRPYLRKYHQPTFDGVCSSEIWVLRSKTPNLEQDYIHLLLQSQRLTKAANIVSGTKMPRANWGLVSNTIVPLPTNYEQKIAISLFRTLDRCIQTTKSLIATKREQKRGLMQELLTGKRRFPSFGEPAIKGGTVPEGWQETALGNIADIRYSNVDKKTAKDELPIRQCNYMDVWKNEYIFDNMAFMQVTASDREISKFQLQVGDVLLTKDSEVPEEIASTALVVTASDDLVLGYHLALIRPDSTNAIGAFISAQLEVPVFKKQLVRAACGATRFGLGIEWLKKAKVWIPGIEEQTAIADLNFKLLREIEHLQSLTSQLREQKRGLMQMLFSGELDLSKLKSIATKVPA